VIWKSSKSERLLLGASDSPSSSRPEAPKEVQMARPQLVTPNGSGQQNGGNQGAPERTAGSPVGESSATKKDAPFSHEPPSFIKIEGHAKTMPAVLGEMVWLMSQSRVTSGRCAPGHKQFFISDLEWPAAQAAKGESS
jgi:hypothetical protein